MSLDTLPIQYHLEIYEKSFVNDPAISFRSDNPFLSFHKGDLLDPCIWDDLIDAQPRTPFRIVDVIHRVWQIEDSHIGHQIGLCIEAAEWPE